MNKILLIFLFISILFFSCKEKQENNKKMIEQSSDFFPDTLKIGDKFSGKIEYLSPLDTINLNGKNSRTVFLFLTTEEGTFQTLDSIRKVNHKVFVIDENSNSIIFNIYFHKTGNIKITGLIEDMVIMEDYYPNGMARVITRLTSIDDSIFILGPN